MSKIYIIGLTGIGEMGQYETQLGNVAILIPMIKLLKSHIPDAEISTTIQLTNNFCKTYGINRVPKTKRLLPLPHFDVGLKLLISIIDLFRASLWGFLKNLLRLNAKILIRGNKLERFAVSDIVLDFNGDIFPSDVHPIRVLNQAIEIMNCQAVGGPCY